MREVNERGQSYAEPKANCSGGGGTSVDTVVIVSGEGGWCLHL